MGYARYVGRVGALAVALGIGVAVANGPGVAWADGDEGSSSGTGAGASSGTTDASTGTTGTSSGGTTDAPSGDPGETSPSDSPDAADDDAESTEDKVTVEEPAAEDGDEDDERASAGGEADSPQPKGDSPTNRKSVSAAPAGDSRRQTQAAPRSDVNATSTVSASTTVSSSTTTGGVDPDPGTRTVAVETVTETTAYRATVTMADVQQAVAVPEDPPLTQAATETITGLFSWLAANPFVDGGPADAPDSPFGWAVFAALRRLTEEDAGTEQRLISVADPVANTLVVEANATPAYELDSSIPVGAGPTGVAVTPDGSRVYVADRFTKSVSVVDTSTRSIVATIPMGAGPNAVAVSPDGSRAYVGLHGVNRVAVIDTATNTVVNSVKVGPGATEIAITPDGSRAYVTNTSGRTVSVIDTAANIEITRVSVGSSPMGLAVTPDGSHVYVANRYSNSVSVIDTATNKVVRTVKVGSSPRSVAIAPDGAHAYVTNAGPDTVSVIETSTNTVVATVRVGRDPVGVAMSPDGALVYAANSNDSVSVIDVATNSVVKTFAVDPKPETGVHYIAVGPDGTVYVTDTRDKMLRVVTATSPVTDVSAFSVQGDTVPAVMVMAAAVVNSGPSAAPTVGLPEAVNGKVTGKLNAVDPEGSPLTYTVRSKSAGASVTVDGAGNFSYTPSQTARLQAATTTDLDTDTFTVRVSDGQAFTDVPVTVVVRPGQLTAGAPIDVDKDPSGVAFNKSGTRAYVTNQYTKTVSVVDTSTGAVVSTIKVPYSPKAVVVSPVGNRAYVAMSSGVAVIDTANNKVVDLNTTTSTVDVIKVGSSPSALAVSADGSRLYVSNGGSSTVSVVDTVTNKEVRKVSVGSQPSGLAISPDGSRVYALSRYSDKVTVFSTTGTNAVLGSARVGDSPRGIVLSPNGQTAYVSNYNSGTVTVLNTAATTPVVVSTITVGVRPEGIAMSQDGTVVYVANARDTLSVIDTKTNTLLNPGLGIDTPAESGAHAIAVAGNKILVTDYVDDWVRVLNVASLKTPPQSVGAPTVSTPVPSTGSVSGDLMVRDTDGDALSYSVSTPPSKGTVSVSPKGIYTYTPTELARQQAGSDTTDTFTVRVSDGTFNKDVAVTVPVLSSANHPPTAPEFQYFYATDSVTGEVRGRVTASDADGDQLTYRLDWGPSGAESFAFDSTTGAFTYVPSREMREAATLYGAEYGYDTFRVTVSDGTASLSPWVNLEVRPVQMAPQAAYPPEVGSANPSTGAVSGSLYVFDPNGDNVTLSVSGAPSRGTATVDSATGTYTYTPFASQRSIGGIDTFTVSATDGQGTSSITVTVPVRAPELSSTQTPIPAYSSGTAIAVSGSRAYVFNKLDWTVSAIDTSTNSVVRTSAPLATGDAARYPGNVAVSPDGTRVHVAHWVDGTISVLDSNTLAPVRQPFSVPSGGDDMVLSPDGKRLYIAHDGWRKSMSIVDTGTGTVVATIADTTPDTTGMVISADGRTIYLADGYNNKVQVIDTTTRTVVGSIVLGPSPYSGSPGGIALSPDGRWAYVTNTVDNTVSVIETTSRTVVGSPIVIGVPRTAASTHYWPTGIAVSRDGSRVYVVNGDDIVVINPATRKVVGAVRFPGYMTDTSNRTSQAIAVDSNGDIITYGGPGLVSVTIGATSAA